MSHCSCSRPFTLAAEPRRLRPKVGYVLGDALRALMPRVAVPCRPGTQWPGINCVEYRLSQNNKRLHELVSIKQFPIPNHRNLYGQE